MHSLLMQATISPGYISGTVTAPPSKSVTQRVLAAALLHNGKTVIRHAGRSDDELAALQIIQQLGARVTQTEETIEITSTGVVPVSGSINCGESGLSARLFTPIAALSGREIRIEATGSLLKRPMHGFKDVLPLLGVSMTGSEHLPMTIQGPLQAQSISINAESGSQFLSGLLFAYSSSAKESVSIKVAGLKSKPYIDLTLEVLKSFGRPISHDHYKEFYIDPSLFTNPGIVEVCVEADWSSAVYLLVAGAIAGSVTVKNLNINSKQADKAILAVLQNAGAGITVEQDAITVKQARLQAFEFDATHCPDLFPVLAILAACCEGESYITGVNRLFHKESNRAESISEMLENFAVPFSLEDDSLCITGVRKLQGTVIDAYHDHRIAMAAAVGALRAGSPVDIKHAEAISKSYPAFYNDLISCGVKCNLA